MPAKPGVTWFANSYHHSIRYIKLGRMRMHRAREIVLRERPNDTAHNLLLTAVREHCHRRTGALQIRHHSRSRRVHAHLHKARPPIPIGPDLDVALPHSWQGARGRGLRHRVTKLNRPWIDWAI